MSDTPSGPELNPDRPRLLVDIVSDPVCPWCYVGFRSFLHARDRIKHEYQVLPRIRAYQLNPKTPARGVDRREYYERKFPDETQREQGVMALKAAAAGAGFQFDPKRPTRLPNTRKAHQVIRLAHFNGAQERVAEHIFKAYWNEGADIGDDAVLIAIAENAGLDQDNVKTDLANAKSANEVLAEASAFRQAGISGVPTFIVNERNGFSGALPPVRLAESLKKAAELTD